MSAVLDAFGSGGLAKVPDSVPLPRFASPVHPARRGSFGLAAESLTASMDMHGGRVSELRPWQQFTLDRALEYRDNGELCWEIVIVSAPRQVGKSVLERVAVMWRLHAAHLFGQTQDVVHIAHNYRTALEVYRPAARWALGAFGHKHVRQASGQQQIEFPDGSRWILQAATDGAGVGYALTMVLVDEAWRINRSVVDAALLPTLTEANSPQLWLVSTAGTSTSDLMRAYRNFGLNGAENILLLEWSAADDAATDISNPDVWRSASPYWDDKRAAHVKNRFENSAEWDFRQQYLNQWVPSLASPLLGSDLAGVVETLQPIPSVPLAFGVDVATDRTHASIVAYGAGIAELVEDNSSEQTGVSWVPGRIRELIDRWNPLCVGFDANGPGASIADALKLDPDLESQILMINGRDMCAASGQFYDAIKSGVWSARPNERLHLALTNAQKRTFGGSWTFQRDTAGSGCPLVAAVIAMWASTHAPLGVESSAIW